MAGGDLLRGLSFLVDGDMFAVDIALVQKVVRGITVTPVPAAPDTIIGIANMNGRVITLINLYKLLRRRERRSLERAYKNVNTIVFKSFSGSEDQMGLVINKTEALIEINEDEIRLSTMVAETESVFCISGVIEVGNKICRLINIESIINMYKNNAE